MGLLSALQSLFKPLPEGAVRYKGYVITATPEQDGNRFRICGNISKGEQQRTFTLVDRVAEKDDCVEMTHRKAKVFIDHQGEGIFI